MPKLATLDPAATPAKRALLGLLRPESIADTASASRAAHAIHALLALVVLSSACPAVKAVDGCTVMLCLAAPKWTSIPPCVPPIRQLFHDLARGRSFPTCKMGSAGGNSAASNTRATNTWAQAPALCPPQYTHLLDIDPGPVYRCDYAGAVSVVINGALFARTWWNTDGQTVTEFTPTAKAQLGTWAPQFDNDYAAWLALQPTPAPVESR